MPTDPNSVKLIWIFTEFLLPLIPSILLFKFLPSTAAVSGPFKGLQINLGGAVGAYFLLVLVIWFGPSPTPPSPSEVWRVKGYVQDENGNYLSADKVNMNVEPRSIDYLQDGSFEMQVLVKRDEQGEMKMPTLNVNWQPTQSFGNATIHLDPADQVSGQKYNLETNQAKRQIRIKEAIKLQQKVPEAPYAPPAGATPQPTALPSALFTPIPLPTSTPKT